MKKIILFSIFLLTAYSYSQVTNQGVPNSWNLDLDNSQIQKKELPSFDLEAVKAEDAENDYKFDAPWRFGYIHSVDYGLEDGVWSTLENGDRIWRILITSPKALSLNFIFDDFYMPEGGYLYLYNNERTDLLGAYDSNQNQDSGVLGTWLVEGDAVWLEYFEPIEVKDQGRLHIAKATHGYRNAETFKEAKGLNDSGDCNLDVDCSIGEDWEELKEHNKRSAGILLSGGGGGFCSGALINNTENDGTPYFLTANHCFSDPSVWAFRFGWISPNTVCATTANSSNGPTNMTLSGATLRARDAGSDFALVEINQNVPEDWDRVFAGWDRSGNTPDFTVGIHHPSGDVMKVCRDDDQPTQTVNGGAQTWEITTAGGGWEWGVTEPGSSGSPLFDTEGRIIGQLYGGGAACSGTVDNNQFDYYGRLDISWEGGGSSSTRLKDWLDPNSTGDTDVNSYPELVQSTCAFPTSISSNVPEYWFGSASFSWTAGESNSSYSWNVYEGTDTSAAAVATGTTTSTSDSVTGLSSNQLYTFVVSSLCDNDEVSNSVSKTFTTNHLITGATTEDFSGYSFGYYAFGEMTAAGSWYAPNQDMDFICLRGGTFADSSSSFYVGASTGGTDGSSGDYFYAGSFNGSSGDSTYILTPYLDVTSMTYPRIAIDYHMHNDPGYAASVGSLTVTVMESDGTETDVISLSGAQQDGLSSAWQTAYGDLSSFMSEEIRIKITATYGGAVNFDDFTVEERPSGQWTGTVDSDWSNASNWQDGIVPDSETSVSIPSSTPNQPKIFSNYDPVIYNLNIDTSSNLEINENASLTILKDFTNNGTINVNLSSTLRVSGNFRNLGGATISGDIIIQ